MVTVYTGSGVGVCHVRRVLGGVPKAQTARGGLPRCTMVHCVSLPLSTRPLLLRQGCLAPHNPSTPVLLQARCSPNTAPRGRWSDPHGIPVQLLQGSHPIVQCPRPRRCPEHVGAVNVGLDPKLQFVRAGDCDLTNAGQGKTKRRGPEAPHPIEVLSDQAGPALEPRAAPLPQLPLCERRSARDCGHGRRRKGT